MVTAISLGFIILGIGFIAWAMFSIGVQSNYADNDTPIATTKENLDTSFAEINIDKPLYPVYPVEGENIGSVTIPDLNLNLPIIQGTNENELNKGVGHFIQSVLPGEKDNCVISGHRETVFRQIGNLKIKDQLILKTSAGTFTYEVTGTRIVDKDDRTVIVPTDHAVLTMTTCYPFNYIGDAPERYIVSSVLVKTSNP